jgi:hypothetical protein
LHYVAVCLSLISALLGSDRYECPQTGIKSNKQNSWLLILGRATAGLIFTNNTGNSPVNNLNMASTAINKEIITKRPSFFPAPVQNLKISGADTRGLEDVEIDIAASLMRTIIYFDVFLYPLNKEELLQYCDFKISDLAPAENALNWLCNNGYLSQNSGFYYIGNDASKVERRQAGNKLAAKRMKDARFYSKIIAAFPFVRAVCISGSLSKNYMDHNSDIDYFIITEPGRLWLSRSMLVLFKKIFLLNSHRNFCINYVVDSNHLAIEERSIYAATETVLLLPMINLQLFRDFLETNKWYWDYYPNFTPSHNIPDIRTPYSKKALEWILNNKLGDLMERFFFRLTIGFWKRKFKNDKADIFQKSIQFSEGVSRHHPLQQHKQIMESYQKKIHEFEATTGLLLHRNSAVSFHSEQ